MHVELCYVGLHVACVSSRIFAANESCFQLFTCLLARERSIRIISCGMRASKRTIGAVGAPFHSAGQPGQPGLDDDSMQYASGLRIFFCSALSVAVLCERLAIAIRNTQNYAIITLYPSGITRRGLAALSRWGRHLYTWHVSLQYIIIESLARECAPTRQRGFMHMHQQKQQQQQQQQPPLVRILRLI